MGLISNGKRYLMVLSGSQNAKDLVRAVDSFNTSDDTLNNEGHFKIAPFHWSSYKFFTRFALVTDNIPTTQATDYCFDDVTKYYITKSKLYLIDLPSSGFDNFRSSSAYRRELDPNALTEFVSRMGTVYLCITKTELQNVKMMGENDNVLRYLYYAYQNQDGDLVRATDGSVIDSGETLMISFMATRLKGTDLFVMVLNDEFLTARNYAYSYWGDTHVTIMNHVYGSFKYQFCNPILVNADQLVGKYHIYTKSNTLGVELFSFFQKEDWANDLYLWAHLNKMNPSLVKVKSPLPYTFDEKSYRVDFDTSGLLPNEKSYFRISFDFGDFFQKFVNKSDRLEYEYVVTKMADGTIHTSEPSPASHAYPISQYIDEQEYDGVRFPYEDIQRVVFCKD